MNLENFLTTSKRWGRNVVLASALGALAFSSCSKKGTEPEPPPPETIISKNTKVVPESSKEEILFYEDDNLLISPESEYWGNLSKGDIIVSDTTSILKRGFWGKVEYVSFNKDTVRFSEPALNEIITRGKAFVNGRLSPENFIFEGAKKGVSLKRTSQGDPLIAIDSVVFEDLDGNYNTTDDQAIANGYMDFEVDYSLDFEMDGGLLKKFDGNFSVNSPSKLEIFCSGESLPVNKKIKLFHGETSPILFGLDQFLWFLPLVQIFTLVWMELSTSQNPRSQAI